MARVRADLLLVQRGLFASRAAAQAAIAAGGVRAGGERVTKASALLDEAAALEAEPAHPYVSRGGLKLAHALEAFAVDPKGRICLDVGASTGGFSDVLLRSGAASVTAVDVGRDQFAATLRSDPRITLYEGLDARALTAKEVNAATSLIVADVSFIGLAKVLPTALSLCAPHLDVLALIKPQFESGPGKRDARGNLDEVAAHSIAEQAAQGLQGLSGLRVIGLVPSPILGGAGAHEWLVHAARG